MEKSGDVWKTIHPKWDMELFKYLFSLEYSFDDIKNSFIETIKGIIINENIFNFEKLSVLNTIAIL